MRQLRACKYAVIFGFCPAAVVGFLAAMELAGPNGFWRRPTDLGLLALWMVILSGLVGGLAGIAAAAVGRAARLSAGRTIWLTVATVTSLLVFLDRFGACYPCHQFLDRTGPHLSLIHI